MKDNEQYFPVVLFVMLYKVVITFESVGEILKCDVGMQMKTAKQYFAVVLFIMLCKVVLTFESVGTILNCDHSNESYLFKFLRVALFSMLFKWSSAGCYA